MINDRWRFCLVRYTSTMRSIRLIIHDIRSCHNVGSLLRTADGFGIDTVYLTGYTPYPATTNDTRLPHIAQKLTRQIAKTALGAEHTVSWQQSDSIEEVVRTLRAEGYQIVALEQDASAISLPTYTPPERVALLLGREVEGVAAELLRQTDTIVEIPMFGDKESFNVAQAAAIALYHLRTAS